MPSKVFHVYIFHHPVEKAHLTVEQIVYRRQTINTLKNRFAPDCEVIILLDGEEIKAEDYKKVKVSVDSKVDIFPTVGLLTEIAAFFGFTSFWSMVGSIAFYMGMAYLGGVLFNQSLRQPKKTEREESQSFSWNPHTTFQEGIPYPRAYGRNLHTGNLVSRWTDVDENGDEILYMIVCYGDGPVKGRVAGMTFINDQPVGNFPGLTLQERKGTFDQTCMTDFEKTKLEYSPGVELITYDGGALTFTTPNKFSDDIEYTLEWNKGLWHYNDMGERESHSMGVKVEISERGMGSWTQLLNTTINGDQMSPIYKAYKASEQGFNCAGDKQYDLRVRKTTADQDPGRFGDDFSLRTMREVINVAFTRPGKVLLGITALATERLSGDLNIKCVWDDRLVNTFNGTNWEIKHTSNRAFAVLDAATQPVISGNGIGLPFTIERYEGLNPSKVDLAIFYEWAEWCDQQVPDGKGGTEDRMPCDFIIDYQTGLWSVVQELSQIGRFYPSWLGNVLTGWIDKVVDAEIDLVTFDTMMTKSWKNAWSDKSELAGSAEIFYRDKLQMYERKAVPVHNENAGYYTRAISLEGTGIVSRTSAIRVGNHSLQRNRLIRNVNSFRMYKDAVRYTLGEVLRLQSGVPDWGKNYLVVQKIDNNTVELDRDVSAAMGVSLYLRSYDASAEDISVETYTVGSVNGKQVTIQESGGWSIDPQRKYVVAIGATKLRRIIKIVPTQDNYFEITVETYDADLFDSDDTQPDSLYPDYAWPAVDKTLDRPVTRWQVLDLINSMMPNAPDIEIPWLANISWSGNSVDTIYWAQRSGSGEDKPLLFRYRGETYEIKDGVFQTTDEFVYWSPDYTTQFRTTDIASVALAAGNWLVCTNKDGVAYPCTPFQLVHAAILLAGTIRAEQYLELRNTMVYNGDDSLDASKPLEIPFKIVSEMTAIISAKLSFRILPYRAYSTGAASGGSSTSGAGGSDTVTSAGGGSGWWDKTGISKADISTYEDTDSSKATIGSSKYTDYESNGSHRHGLESGDGLFGGHVHGIPSGVTIFDGHEHSIDLGDHTHQVTIEDHTHSTPNHVHGIVYAIHEESNSPTIHFHIDNGTGYGAASGNYNSDQLDIDIKSQLSGVGWKDLRFDTDLRCRVVAIIELKLDITA